ncbi:hypothetical protein GGF46_001284 [Coemansia sp. RSA 552]|nr:hypothetical protein GGF46_001284 [Coemansia sp. RSA 552]
MSSQGGAPPDAGVSRERSGGEESDQEVGPVPSREHVPPLWERSRGGSSVPGEGPSSSSSRAGERLLGRGEFGLDHGRIERLEGAGYVMSGNRHRRANPAVRVPKDGQAITADEKRQILMQNQEERQKKETQVIAEFREMLSKKR